MTLSNQTNPARSANHRVRKLLGRAYLRANRIPEALEVYKSILLDCPNDQDVLLVLGNLYRLAGCNATALRLIEQVLIDSPEHELALRMSAELQGKSDAPSRDGDPLCPEAIELLAVRLQNQTAALQQDEIRMAADVLEKPGANGHGQELNDQQLLPALIEMNIRQARASGSPEIAEALQSLQINLSRQVEDQWADALLKDDFSPE